MIFIDEPKFVALSGYEIAVNAMTNYLSALPGLLCVYQIGGFGAPGISDIDMVAVFEDGTAFTADPQSELSGVPRYLFAHQLFGTSKSLFHESQKYTAFHNYKLLWGEEQRTSDVALDAGVQHLMKQQLAMEYLVRMWVNMIVEKTYAVHKVRNLLLQGNGLTYDLEFLQVKPAGLSKCLETILNWRAQWFDTRPDNKRIGNLYTSLFNELQGFLNQQLKDTPLYLPDMTQYLLGKNIALHEAPALGFNYSGFRLPWMPESQARKIMSVLSRVSRFTVNLPFKNSDIPTHITQSFDYTRRAQNYNRENLPYFMPLTSSLVLQETRPVNS